MKVNFKLGIGVLLLALLMGFGGYLLGTSQAPTVGEARELEQLSFQDARASAFTQAFSRAKVRGVEGGAKRGRMAGRNRGQSAGQGAGQGDAAVRLAEIAESQEPSGIQSPFAPGEILPPIPPGATEPNPTELCNQAPISAAEFGYSCP